MLHVDQLVKRLPSGQELLRGVGFRVRRGEFVGLLGPSGAGKSLTIRCLLGLTRATSGTIQLDADGERFDLTAASGRRLRRARRQMGVVFQNFNLIGRLSVLENVLLGRLGRISPWRSWFYGFTDQEAAEAMRVLRQLEMESFAERRAATLSGGEMQRVAIARCMFQEPAIYLADEPLSSLDPRNARGIMEILARLAEDAAVLGVFHQPEIAARYCTRIIAMQQGRIVYDGEPDLTSAQLAELYGAEFEQVTREERSFDAAPRSAVEPKDEYATVDSVSRIFEP